MDYTGFPPKNPYNYYRTLLVWYVRLGYASWPHQTENIDPSLQRQPFIPLSFLTSPYLDLRRGVGGPIQSFHLSIINQKWQSGGHPPPAPSPNSVLQGSLLQPQKGHLQERQDPHRCDSAEGLVAQKRRNKCSERGVGLVT